MIILLKEQSQANKEAWSYRAYEFWSQKTGLPKEAAEDMKRAPEKRLRRFLKYLGPVQSKKIANLLGSNGRMAVPLAILGADVTIVDISEENRRYALELAEAAEVGLTYIVSDFLEWDSSSMDNSFDIAFLEGGILHYFLDLKEFANKIYGLLKLGGKLVLNDFHPFRKVLKVRDIFAEREDKLELTGNYFENEVQVGEVAYEKFFSENEQKEFPKCLLRFWTMGEIITAFAAAGFVIESLEEGPRFDEHKSIPGEFTLVAYKLKVER